jgi:hypothetical protein
LELLRPLRALLAPAEAPRLVAIGETELLLIDTTSPLRPVRAAVRPLPAWVRGKGRLRAALSPDGKHLALALAERNRLVVLAVDELRPAHEPRRAELSIVPEVLAPAIADVTFAPDGRTLWLVSGVTAESKTLGPQPTRVHVVRVQSSADGTPELSRARVVDLAAATQPVAIVTGRAQPLASGAAIRLPPERALVHVAAYSSTDGHPGVFTIGPDDAATTVLSDRNGGLIGRPEVSADEAWLLAPCGDRTSGWKVLGVARAGQGAVTALPIGSGAAGAAGESRDSLDARSFMEIKVQP